MLKIQGRNKIKGKEEDILTISSANCNRECEITDAQNVLAQGADEDILGMSGIAY